MQTQAKAIILARVSSRAQEDEGYSLDSQLKLMRSYCTSKKLVIVEEFKIAETASKDQRRKIYHEMVEYITRHRIYHIVVEKTDRLTRNFRDATTIDSWLERDERRMLHLVKENLLLHKEARSDAKFMWNIYLSVAKKYTDNLREESMKGWAEKLAQGWLPASPPPGYMTITQAGKRIHVVNPDTYKFMLRVFELALLPGYTLRRLSEEMALMGMLTGKGRPFAPSSVADILRNPFYIGINRMQGKEYPGAQEPIITKKLFNAVQRKLKGSRSFGSRRKHEPIFKGMITCRTCGKLISWSKQKGRFYGSCPRLLDACRSGRLLREDRVEALIIGVLEEIKDPKGKLFGKLQKVLEATRPQDVDLYRQKMVDELTSQLNQLRRMDARLYDDKLAGLITKGVYQEKQHRFALRAADIVGRLELLQEVTETIKTDVAVNVSRSKIANLYLQSSPADKRAVMSRLFTPFTACDGHVSIELS